MKILVACEESQTVAKEFRKVGHEAYSCDIMECSGGHPEWHLKQDVTSMLKEKWDMIIAFPPCTYLCSSGMHWTTRGLRDPQLTEDALKFVKVILETDCEKIVLENPIGCISTRIRKYDQKIQPWFFGEDASKGTCLWLKGVEPLVPTKIIPPKGYSQVIHASDCMGISQDKATYKRIEKIDFVTIEKPAPKPVWKNQTPSGQNKLGPSPDRAKLRSKTYKGIAKAMAEQW